MTRSFICFAAAFLFAVAVAAFAQPPASEPEGLPKNLGEYDHINAIVVPDPESPVMGFHHFYMNDKGLETFRADKKGAKYPAGTIIVGKVYQPEKTEDGAYKEGDLLAYTVMRKDPENPATKDTGGWHFQKFDSQAARVTIDAVADCFNCHKPHAATDFVISEPLD